jgi:hypothetical protein
VNLGKSSILGQSATGPSQVLSVSGLRLAALAVAMEKKDYERDA